MRKIVEVVSQSLDWVQPTALEMRYELRAGDDPVATLVFRNMFGSFATGRSADGCWTFKRVGFFRTWVSIRECDRDDGIAEFRNSTWSGGGQLELSDRRRFPATTNFWQTNLELQDETGAALIRLKTRGLIHLAAAVEIEPRAVEIAELPWMVMLGWYLAVMMRSDSSGGAAAAAAAG
jgi:hypothetical protein